MNKVTRILETTFSTIGRAGLAFLILLVSFSSSYAQIGCVMVCDYSITVEVPAGGSVEFLPTDMLEGNLNQQCPNGVFQAQVQLNNVFLPASGNFVFDSTHIGQTYIGQIRDEVSGNACWGEVHVTGNNPNGCVMVCNDVITVEVPAGGSVEFLPTDMLEGNLNQQCPNGVFQAQVQLNNVFLPASGNFVFDSTHIGQTYIGQIRDEVSGNACWGEVQVTGSSPNISGAVSLFEPDGAMEVSPNPSNHSIILKVASQESTFKVRVLDMKGRLVLQQTIQNEGKLDVSGLPNGLYLLWAITPSGKMFRSKFEKQG